MNEMHLKYVDDLSLVEAVNLKEQLTEVSIELRPQPDNFHARTGSFRLLLDLKYQGGKFILVKTHPLQTQNSTI